MHYNKSGINIILIEKREPVRNGWEFALVSYKGKRKFHIQGCFKDIKEALRYTQFQGDSVIILGLDENVPAALLSKFICSVNTGAKTLVCLNSEEGENILEIIAAGAAGIVEKKTPPAVFIETVICIAEGKTTLSTAAAQTVLKYYKEADTYYPGNKIEKQILSEIAAGKSFKAIAEALDIPAGQIGKFLKSVYKNVYKQLNDKKKK